MNNVIARLGPRLEQYIFSGTLHSPQVCKLLSIISAAWCLNCYNIHGLSKDQRFCIYT